MSDETARRARIAGGVIGVTLALLVSVTYWIYPHWWIAIPFVILGITATRLAQHFWIDKAAAGSG